MGHSQAVRGFYTAILGSNPSALAITMLKKVLTYLEKKRNFFPFCKNNELRFVFKNFKRDTQKIKLARFVENKKIFNLQEIDDIDIATILSINEIKERFDNTNF